MNEALSIPSFIQECGTFVRIQFKLPLWQIAKIYIRHQEWHRKFCCHSRFRLYAVSTAMCNILLQVFHLCVSVLSVRYSIKLQLEERIAYSAVLNLYSRIESIGNTQPTS